MKLVQFFVLFFLAQSFAARNDAKGRLRYRLFIEHHRKVRKDQKAPGKIPKLFAQFCTVSVCSSRRAGVCEANYTYGQNGKQILTLNCPKSPLYTICCLK